MAELAFDLEYEGPALEAHEMDVRQLAPALLSAADLFQELNRQLHPTDPDVAVNVRATSEGSFLVQLKILHDETLAVLGGGYVEAAANLVALVEAVGTVVLYLKRKRARPAPPVEEVTEEGLVRLIESDGTVFEVPRAVAAAANNVAIRRSLSEVMRPLGHEGVESVTIRRDEIVISQVTKDEVFAFEVEASSNAREVLPDAGDRQVYLTILNAAFKRNNKWRLSDGQSDFWATVEDREFLARVDSGEAFSKLDVLRCRIRDKQWRDDTGQLHNDVTVLEVLEHLPPAQGRLDLGA